MEKQHLHRIFALLFAVVVLFPTTIQAIHALEKHEHTVCTAKDIKHIHQQNDDCSVYHAQIHTTAFDFTKDFTILDLKIQRQVLASYVQKDYSLSLFSKSSRAPPIIIV